MNPLTADIIIICDGMADKPGCSLSLPPTLSWLRDNGNEALVDNVPTGMPVSSEIAISSILGADPSAIPGRGALEALGLGVTPSSGVIASRFDLSDRSLTPSQGHEVVCSLRTILPAGYSLVEGRGFRHLLLRPIDSSSISMPDVRIWGDSPLPGSVPLPGRNVMIAGAPVVLGLARFLGWRIPHVSGATGSVDTDLNAKTTAALNALAAGAPKVCVHIEAPDEASHLLRPDLKNDIIRDIDTFVITPLIRFAESRHLSVVVLSDHAASPVSGSHLRGPVPALFFTPVDKIS